MSKQIDLSKIIYVDEIPFDERFETLLFVNFSETELSRLVPDPLFFEDFQFRFVSYHLDRQLQDSIVATNTPEFTESASQTLGPSEVASSSRIPTEPSFIPTIPIQPEISDQQSTVVSPPSPPHTPRSPTAPSPPVSPRQQIINPPRVMATRFAPLALPANLDPMHVDY